MRVFSSVIAVVGLAATLVAAPAGAQQPQNAAAAGQLHVGNSPRSSISDPPVGLTKGMFEAFAAELGSLPRFRQVSDATTLGSGKSRRHNARVEAGLQQVLDQAVAKQGVFLPGAIAHYRHPAFASWSGSAGLGDLQAQTPMRPGDRIRAGSILKTFVATVVLQHVEEGTLSLDQTLAELLPSVTGRLANTDRITLRMLLNHTSGIPEWVTDEVHAIVAAKPAYVWTENEAIQRASIQPAYFEPGTSWRYSNTNYTLIGMVLDRVGGKSWRAQVRERVLAPLGLTSTELPEPGDRTVAGDYAHGYQDIGGGSFVELSYVDPSMAGASGGNAMITTVQDLGRFLDALLAGRLFERKKTLVEMLTMVDAPDETKLPHRYGLGIESFDGIAGTTIIGNSGGAAGYTAMMFYIPSRATTLVTVVNTSDLYLNALEVFIPAADVIIGKAQR